MVRALRSCRLTEATAEAIVRKAMARAGSVPFGWWRHAGSFFLFFELDFVVNSEGTHNMTSNTRFPFFFWALWAP